MKQPSWTAYYSVDTMIECFNIQKETRRELHTAAPDAYGDETVFVSRVWDKLSDVAQADLVTTYEKEK